MTIVNILGFVHNPVFLAIWILQIVGCLIILRKQKIIHNLMISGLLFLSFQALYCLPFTFDKNWSNPINYTKQLLDFLPTFLLAYLIYKFKALDKSSSLTISAIIFIWAIWKGHIFNNVIYWRYFSFTARSLFCILALTIARCYKTVKNIAFTPTHLVKKQKFSPTPSTLDVGCGARRRALIRLDVNKTKEANILGSAHQLPFRNKTFQTVFCYHVLEHLSNPKQALRELCRVGESIKIKLPFLFYHHKNKFDFRCLGLKWNYGLDRERKRFGVPFRVELSASFKSAKQQ